MAEPTVGDRVAQERRRQAISQEELAERAGVSLATVAKLEQNVRTGARLATINAIARALGVRTSTLFGPADLDHAGNGDVTSLLPLRRALSPSPLTPAVELDELPSLDELRREVDAVGAASSACRYSEVLDAIPGLIETVRAVARETAGDDRQAALTLLARVHLSAGTLATQHRHEDLAFIAIGKAIKAAEETGDLVLRSNGIYHLGWAFMRQGRFDDTEELATKTAEAIEPRLSRASVPEVAVWGRLLTQASAAAARNNRPAAARSFVTLAKSAATRLERDQFDRAENHWVAFGPTTVDAIEVENAMTGGEPDRALRLARNVTSGDQVPGVTWSRHLLTVAEAFQALKVYDKATATLLSVHQVTPEWLGKQRLGIYLIKELFDASTVQRARVSGLDELAPYVRA